MKRHFDARTVKAWLEVRPRGWIYTCAGILIAVLTVAEAGLMLNLRERSLRATERNLASSARTLAAEADRAFQSVDLLLAGLAERMAPAGVVDSDSYRRLMSDKATHLLLQEKRDTLAQLDAIAMVDATGRLINFSRYWPTPAVSVADRDYFRALKDDPTRHSFISKPVQNRGNGSWTIYLARRVEGRDGSFSGLVLGAMTMRYFQVFYRSVLPGESSAISMIRDDGLLLARYPMSDAVGKPFPDRGSASVLRDDAGETIRDQSPIDGHMRIKGRARVEHYPIIILSTMTQAEALRDWSSAALTLALITAGCAGAIVLAAMAVGRWWRQQEYLARAREEQAAAEHARIAAEAQLMREREESATAANRAKSAFLAMMSHEIRTPMNAVLGLADALLDGELEGDKRKLVATIRESGDVLLRLLNDILDFSKVEAGRIEFETIPFAPAAVGESLLGIMGPRAAAKGLALTHEIDPGVPAAVAGDPGRIRQILVNLVSNAVKFTAAGKVAIVTRCAALRGEEATIEWIVSDTGIGIAADKIGALFTEFSQSDNSITRRFGGSGLGLAISKRLIEQMGGSIGVESEEGRGATFRLRLPLSLAEAPAEPVHAQAGGEAELARFLRDLGRPLRILLAEDNPTNQFVVVQQLRDLDIRVTVAHDGVEAVESAVTAVHDLILMDMQMPEMDGIAATSAIRRGGGRLATVPIVALTANALPEDAESCRAAGMGGFLAKPVKRQKLIEMILAVLSAPDSALAQTPPPALDAPVLEALTRELGTEVVAQMIEVFIASTEAQLAALAEPLGADDLLRAVHSLKGAARSAGAATLAAAAASAEARLRTEGGSTLPERQAIVDAYTAFRAMVAPWRSAPIPLRAAS